MHVARRKLPSSFVRVGWSSVLAQLAEQVALTAAPLIAVALFDAQPTDTALLQVANTLPFLLLSLLLGVLVDRTGLKRLLLASEALRALTLAGTVVLLACHLLTFPLLVIIGFVGAIGTVVISVAAPTAVARLVTRDQLTDANRWIELGRSAAFIGGPAAAGLLVAWVGAPGAFVAATVLSVFGGLLLLRLDRLPSADTGRRSVLRALREGAAFAWSHALLRPVIVTSFAFNVGWFVIQAVFVVYAVRSLSMDAAQIGFTLAVYGLGMIGGAAAAPAILRRIPLGVTILLGPVGGFLAALTLALTLLLPAGALAGVCYFLFGFGPVIWAITTTSLRQAVTPLDMLGRVSSVLVVATYGARPIGAALAVLAGGLWGTTGCLLLASALLAAQLVYLARSALARLRTLDEATAALDLVP